MAQYRKVLVLMDLAEGSERVFAAARDIAAYSNAAIVALHVVEYVPAEPMGESLMPTQIDLETGLAERARAARGPGEALRYAGHPRPGGDRQHQGADSDGGR